MGERDIHTSLPVRDNGRGGNFSLKTKLALTRQAPLLSRTCSSLISPSRPAGSSMQSTPPSTHSVLVVVAYTHLINNIRKPYIMKNIRKLIAFLKSLGPVQITRNKSYFIPLKFGHSPVDVHTLTQLAVAVNSALEVTYNPNGTTDVNTGKQYGPSLFVGLPNSASDDKLEALASSFVTNAE